MDGLACSNLPSPPLPAHSNFTAPPLIPQILPPPPQIPHFEFTLSGSFAVRAPTDEGEGWGRRVGDPATLEGRRVGGGALRTKPPSRGGPGLQHPKRRLAGNFPPLQKKPTEPLSMTLIKWMPREEVPRSREKRLLGGSQGTDGLDPPGGSLAVGKAPLGDPAIPEDRRTAAVGEAGD